MKPGTIVTHDHPAWGPSRGRILADLDADGRYLVGEITPTGGGRHATELWPASEVRATGGAPGKPPERRRETVVRVRVTEAELVEIDRRAKQRGQTRSQFLRSMVGLDQSSTRSGRIVGNPMEAP